MQIAQPMFAGSCVEASSPELPVGATGFQSIILADSVHGGSDSYFSSPYITGATSVDSGDAEDQWQLQGTSAVYLYDTGVPSGLINGGNIKEPFQQLGGGKVLAKNVLHTVTNYMATILPAVAGKSDMDIEFDFILLSWGGTANYPIISFLDPVCGVGFRFALYNNGGGSPGFRFLRAAHVGGGSEISFVGPNAWFIQSAFPFGVEKQLKIKTVGNNATFYIDGAEVGTLPTGNETLIDYDFYDFDVHDGAESIFFGNPDSGSFCLHNIAITLYPWETAR